MATRAFHEYCLGATMKIEKTKSCFRATICYKNQIYVGTGFSKTTARIEACTLLFTNCNGVVEIPPLPATKKSRKNWLKLSENKLQKFDAVECAIAVLLVYNILTLILHRQEKNTRS